MLTCRWITFASSPVNPIFYKIIADDLFAAHCQVKPQ